MDKLNRDEIIYIARILKHSDLFNFMQLNKKIYSYFDDNFWRLKLKDYGMKDVSKENVENSKEAFKEVTIDEIDIFHATMFGLIYRSKYLLERGASSRTMNLCLKNAASRGHLNIVQYLVQKKAHIHTDNDDALTNAARFGHLDVVRYLVENGADILQSRAVTQAQKYGHSEICDYLAKEGIKSIILKEYFTKYSEK